MDIEWVFQKEPEEQTVEAIKSSLGFGHWESKILAIRGIDNYSKARAFFRPTISDIHSPFEMKDMQKAVDKIVAAIKSNKKILIYGDYDVDGTSAVALMYLYISMIYDKNFIGYYIPDRFSEGYGISIKGIDYAKKHGFSLIISLDCGIKSFDEVEYAKALGIDFIICDHHLPGDKIPNAIAVLDPKQQDCHYPYKELSGCGVGFKLCQALNSVYNIPKEELYNLTDLLAISIASDIVSLTGENRLLTKLGLKKIRKSRKPWLKSFVSHEKLGTMTVSNIVFEIAPKINAAGRISHANTAVELMICEDEKQAQEIVTQILELNNLRKEMDDQITLLAKKQVEREQEFSNGIIVYESQWNKGVIGIVASRLVESYYKPTIVFTDGENGQIVGSARSVSNFDIYGIIEQCSDLLLKFGGHCAAAGLTMRKDKFQEFKTRFEELVKQNIQEYQKTPILKIDLVVNHEVLNSSFFDFHHKLEPFGPDNMKPVLVLKNMKALGIQKMGKEQTHIKFYIQNGNTGINIQCVGFGFGNYEEDLKKHPFDMAFSIEENYWRGNKTHYLNIKDIKINKNL